MDNEVLAKGQRKLARLAFQIKASLRWKVILYSYSSTLMLALVAVVLIYQNYRAERPVSENVTANLAHAGQIAASVIEERLASLKTTAGLVASFPDLKALLATDVLPLRTRIKGQAWACRLYSEL